MSDLTITTGELLSARTGLLIIGEFAIPSIKAAYALTKLKTRANAALEDLEKTRIAACEQYAKKDDAGKPVTDDKGYVFEDRAAFDAAWQALLAEPVTLSGCRALAISEFDGAAQTIRHNDGPPEIIRGVPPDVFFSLGPLVVEAADGPALVK